MPSGARRRKAAKRKKQKEPSSSSNTHSHGNNEVNCHDEKESEGAKSQDHHDHQHSSNKGEEVEKSEPVEGAGVNGENAVAIDESNVIEIDWELKPEEEDPGSKTVESVKEPHKDKSSSSSSSSSDDESFTVKKKIVTIESGEPEKHVLDPAVESGSLAELVKNDDSSEVTLATDAVPAEDSSSLPAALQKDLHVSDNAQSVSLADLADLPEVTQVTDSAQVVKADSAVVETSTEEADNVVALALPLITPENVSNEVEHVLDSNVSDLGLKENGQSKISDLTQVVTDVGSQPTNKEVSSTGVEDGKSKISEHTQVVTDAGSQLIKKEVPSTEVEISTASSNVEGFQSHKEEDKLLPASVPVTDVGNGTEQSNVYAVPECSEKQPLVASAPRPVQTTSWSGCCGLFELFTGSSR